jgi:hypothetical protein
MYTSKITYIFLMSCLRRSRFEESAGKKPPRCKLKDNIKTHLKETVSEDVWVAFKELKSSRRLL